MKGDAVETLLRPRNRESNDAKDNTCVELGRGVGEGEESNKKTRTPRAAENSCLSHPCSLSHLFYLREEI